jgi:hypothetical protein
VRLEDKMHLQERKAKPANATWIDSANLVADVDHPLGDIVISLYDDGAARVTFKKAGPGVIVKAYLEGKDDDIILGLKQRV